MKKVCWYGIAGIFIAMSATVFFIRGKVSMGIEQDKTGYQFVKDYKDACNVYPLTVADIEARAAAAKEKFGYDVSRLITRGAAHRDSVRPLIRSLDQTIGYVHSVVGGFELISMVHPDKDVRDTATRCSQEIQACLIDHFSGNKALYETFKNCSEVSEHYPNRTAQEVLTLENYADEALFLTDLLEEFKRSGMDLPDRDLAEVTALQKQLSDLSSQFGVNVAQDNRTVLCLRQELQGVPEEFIATLALDADGQYILKTDYPTSDMVMTRCAVEETRKKFYRAMNNRGYPQNKKVLESVIELRDRLAKKLGFKSYSHYSLEDQMIKTPENAWNFQEDLLPRMLTKAKAEIKVFARDLPVGVSLTKDGKFKPWDVAYTTTYFKKKYYDIDELQLAEFFPMENTVKGLFAIYEKFFSLSFKEIENITAWHSEVRLLEISKQNGPVIGYVFLDMFPRDNKFGHAAQFSGIAAHKDAKTGTYYPAVCTVVCNFTPPTADKPSLLKYGEVNTFFHEFGHALHTILGATDLVTQSGTSVKRDFVEMPSQMLENWMEEKEILLMLGKNYRSGESLAADMIQRKLDLLLFGEGLSESRQIGLGMFALACFDEGAQKDTDALVKKYAELTAPYYLFDEETHFQYSFGHLMGYGAKYYGYLWSRVIAADLFEEIKKEGLLSPEAGKKYAECILVPGGSRDPNDMLYSYLGRAPRQDAFLKRLG